MAIIIHMPSVKRGKKRTGSSSEAPKDPILETSEAPLAQSESLSDNSGVGDHEGEEIYEDDENYIVQEEEEEEEEEEVPNRSFDSLPYDEDDEEEDEEEEEGAENEAAYNEAQIVGYENEEEEEVEEQLEEEELENDEEGDKLVHIEEFDNEGQIDEWEEYNEEILELEWGYNNQVDLEDEGEDDGDGSVVDPVEFNNEQRFDDHLSFRITCGFQC